MSNYNWESGTVKLPTSEWTKFKKDFRDSYNDIQNDLFAKALEHWNKYKAGKLPKWDRNNTQSENDVASQFESEKGDTFYMLWQELQQVKDSKFPRVMRVKRKRPRKPIRKDFQLANNRQAEFHFDEASITFINKTREVHYYSGDNNHSVESARDHLVGHRFFVLLDRVKWVRGTGGQFIGNDEYNQDRGGVGGGGNYETAKYPMPKNPAAMSKFY